VTQIIHPNDLFIPTATDIRVSRLPCSGIHRTLHGSLVSLEHCGGTTTAIPTAYDPNTDYPDAVLASRPGLQQSFQATRTTIVSLPPYAATRSSPTIARVWIAPAPELRTRLILDVGKGTTMVGERTVIPATVGTSTHVRTQRAVSATKQHRPST